MGLAVRKQVEKDHEKANHRPAYLPTVSEVPAQVRQDASLSSCTSSFEDESPVELDRIATARTQHSLRTALGHALSGIHARERTTHEGKGEKVFVVDWEGEGDPLNPRNWSVGYRACITLIVSWIGFVVGAASSADSAILPQAAAEFGVSEVVESMALGM